MPAETKSRVLEEYLGRVRSHLPLRRGGDILRELESSIRDRIDDLAASERREPDDDLVRRALAGMGEPESVAGAFVKERSLVAPGDFRAFLVSTSVLVAVHLVLLGVATTLDRALGFGPAAIAPIAGSGLFAAAAAAVHALLLDVGLMVLVFAATGALRGRIGGSMKIAPVETAPRAVLGRIVLSALVGVLLNVFRGEVFMIVSGDETYPLFTEWFGAALPLVNAVLVLAIVSDALYLVLAETRLTLAVDALHGLAGLMCMLFLLHGGAILATPGLEEFADVYGPMNDFLAQLGELVVGFLALALAVKTVRRLIRFAQI